MLTISQRFGRSMDEVHRIFYEVSCRRELLIKVLEGKKDIKPWSTLEDLALRNPEHSPSFQLVLKERGRDEVDLRRAFL